MRSFPLRLPLARAFLAAAFLLLSAHALAAPRTVLVFGDSLAAAYGLATEQGWVHLLGLRASRAGLDTRVVNASVSGETTAGGVRRLPDALQRHKPSIVVIELGANDALRGQPIAAIRANLERMIRMVRDAKAQPVLVGIMIPPNYGIDYANEFRDVFPSLARKHGIPLVPFLLEGIADKPDMFLADQLHPSAAAQERLLDNVWKTLEPLLRRKT